MVTDVVSFSSTVREDSGFPRLHIYVATRPENDTKHSKTGIAKLLGDTHSEFSRSLLQNDTKNRKHTKSEATRRHALAVTRDDVTTWTNREVNALPT